MFEQRYVRRLRLVLVGLAVVLMAWIFWMGSAPQGHAEVKESQPARVEAVTI